MFRYYSHPITEDILILRLDWNQLHFELRKATIKPNPNKIVKNESTISIDYVKVCGFDFFGVVTLIYV